MKSFLFVVLFSLSLMLVGCATTPTETSVRKVSLDETPEQSATMIIDTPYGKRPVRNPLRNVSFGELAKDGAVLETTIPGKTTKISHN